MNVHNTGQILKPHFQVPKSTANKSDSNVVESSTGKKLESNAIKSSTILERLNKSTSDLRESLLNEVKTNLQAGVYNSRQAAESVANAILES